jgi:hypothetical protein
MAEGLVVINKSMSLTMSMCHNSVRISHVNSRGTCTERLYRMSGAFLVF